ncbi:MAG: hypothetical protein GY762_18275 [Proteobacteria bacterium]|nr:hypothetical protein [Pseudomonadota bacterium]
MNRATRCLFFVALLAGLTNLAHANEYTDVIDAADDDNNDPFDANISVGYERFQRSANIRREDINGTSGSGDYYAEENAFKYKHVAHILNLNLDIGLYKDFALKFRLPLVLNDQRELKAYEGWDNWGDSNGDALFDTPLKAAERSGVDYFAVGLWWGIFNQERDNSMPTWVLFAETRIGVGKEMEAACSQSGSDDCGSLTYDGGAAYNTKSGVGRGLIELVVGTRFSKRIGIIDPYFGIEALIGFAKKGSPYRNPDNEDGAINSMPPIVGSIDIGMEIIPWEIPERHLKFAIGVGGGGKYHSEGRAYSPLFDALGTSRYLHDNPFPGDESAAAPPQYNYSGMTDSENFATFYGRLYLMIQPAKYIKFRVGSDVAHETDHLITKTDECRSENEVWDGSTYTCSRYNYDHRPEIDSPGRRFRVDKTLVWQFFVDATAMF